MIVAIHDALESPMRMVSRCINRGWKIDYPVEAYAVQGDDSIGCCLVFGYLSEAGKGGEPS
jgi:hypothetical protein